MGRTLIVVRHWVGATEKFPFDQLGDVEREPRDVIERKIEELIEAWRKKNARRVNRIFRVKRRRALMKRLGQPNSPTTRRANPGGKPATDVRTRREKPSVGELMRIAGWTASGPRIMAAGGFGVGPSEPMPVADAESEELAAAVVHVLSKDTSPLGVLRCYGVDLEALPLATQVELLERLDQARGSNPQAGIVARASRLLEIARSQSVVPSPVSRGTDGQSVGPPEETHDLEMTKTGREIIQALFESGAAAKTDRMRAEDIAPKATGNHEPGHIKNQMKPLLVGGLVESKTGRGGGYWLTAKGVDFARERLSRDQLQSENKR